MKIRIYRSSLEEVLLLTLFFFYILIAHWIWFGRGIQESVMILLSIMILLKKKKQYILMKRIPDICLVIVLVAVCFFGILSAQTHEYLLADLKAMGGTVIVSIAVVASIERLKEQGIECLEWLFSFLNKYFILNSIIIVIQYFVPYFLMNKTAIASVGSSTYFDQITGLLGINGTTRWNIWSAALIILNFYTAKKRKDTRIIVYNIMFLLGSVLISMLNSARAFLIVAPVTVFIYVFVILKMKVAKRVKQVFAVFFLAITGLVVYLVSPYVKGYVDDLISDKFAIYLSGDIDYMVAANDDRVVATNYAVKNSGILGVGIGSVPMHSSNSQVKYLGINSASAYIYIIGVGGYFLCTLCLARAGLHGEKNQLKKTVIYFFYLLLLSYFLPIYSSFALLPAIMIIFYIFEIAQRMEM